MYALQFSLLIHFLGIGLLCTSLFAGWILDSRYRSAAGWDEKLLILKLLRPVGLLSPVGIVVMLLSGIGNMHLEGLGIFSESWLTLKLVFFTLAVISGILFGIRGTQRARLVSQLAGGTAPEGSDRSLKTLNRQQRLFFVVQFVLIVIILSLSLFKP